MAQGAKKFSQTSMSRRPNAPSKSKSSSHKGLKKMKGVTSSSKLSKAINKKNEELLISKVGASSNSNHFSLLKPKSNHKGNKK